MLYKVDSSSGDVVIYWTMTSTHVVPDRKQYDEHTHQADMIPGVSKYFVSNSSLNKYLVLCIKNTTAVWNIRLHLQQT